MRNITILMMIMGFAVVSACASNETTGAAGSDASDNAEMMKEEQSAAMAAEQAEAKTKTDMEMTADEAVEQTEEKVEAATTDEPGDATNVSGNFVSTCEYGDQVRVIRVVYDNPETDYVCEVSYEKSTGVQTLWSANNDRDYCLDKAAAFVKKQEGWGWTCSSLE